MIFWSGWRGWIFSGCSWWSYKESWNLAQRRCCKDTVL